MAHALHASAFAGAKVAPMRAARSSASTGRKSVVTRAMAAKTLSIPKTFEDLKKIKFTDTVERIWTARGSFFQDQNGDVLDPHTFRRRRIEAFQQLSKSPLTSAQIELLVPYIRNHSARR